MTALRDAFRALRHSPLFAVAAVLSLGLALALNTTMFAVVDAQLHPPAPYPAPDQVFQLMQGGGDRRRPVPMAELIPAVREALAGRATVLTFGIRYATVQTRTETADDRVAEVTPELLHGLGVRAAVGRFFTEPDAGEALVSQGLWQRWFGGRPLAEGLQLQVGARSFTVVGVMPRGMHFPASVDVWIPTRALAGDTVGFRFGPLLALRLADGVDRSRAQAALDVVARRLDAEYGTPSRPIALQLYADRVPPRELRGLYGVLLVAVAVVLLVACTNLATLMLARATARSRELALRLALGATRGDILRSVLAEAGLLALAGGAVGLLLAHWALAVVTTKGVRLAPELADVSPSPGARAFAFVLGLTVVTMLVAGLIPAVRASATDPATPLKDGAGTTTGRHGRRHHALVALQVGLATALLMAAMLLLDSAARMRHYTFPFDARRLVTASLRIGGREMPDGRDVARLYDDVVSSAAALPDVMSAATVAEERPDGPMVVGEDGRSGTRWVNLGSYRVVSPDYLRTMGIAVREGRDFSAGDRGGEGVVIVDRDAARLLWPDVPSPVGHLIKLGRVESPRPWLRVIGVASSVHSAPRRATDTPPEPSIYVVHRLDSARTRNVLVRSAGDPAASAVALRGVLRSVGPRLPGHVAPWLQPWTEHLVMTTTLASLFAAFGVFALVLAAVGLYGVLAYAVSRRIRELAVRVALGADAWDVGRLVVRDAAVITLAGVGLGALVALAATRGIIDTLFDQRWVELRALVAAELVLFAVALVASTGPVRRALRADPVEILRAS